MSETNDIITIEFNGITANICEEENFVVLQSTEFNTSITYPLNELREALKVV